MELFVSEDRPQNAAEGCVFVIYGGPPSMLAWHNKSLGYVIAWFAKDQSGYIVQT